MSVEEQNMSNTSVQKKKLPAKYLIVLAVIVIIASLATGAYFYYQYRLIKKQFQAPIAAQEEARNLAAEVGKLVVLPIDEVPTIATVSDIFKLKDQPFFKDAKNGDKVLIYAKAKKAILYDPTIHKVKGIGPLNVANQAGTTQDTQAKPNIAIKNGTDTVGLAAKAEEEIKNVVSGANIVSREQAKKKYDKTIVVILNNDLKSVGNTLANFYNASVVDLPSDETRSEGADVLVILGKDRSVQISTPSPTPK